VPTIKILKLDQKKKLSKNLQYLFVKKKKDWTLTAGCPVRGHGMLSMTFF